MKTYLKNSGFTLVEVLVASVIGVFIALVALATLRAVSTSAEMIDSSTYVSAELRFASDILRRDLMNLYREADFEKTKFIGIVEQSAGGGGTSGLIFDTISKTKARVGEPEGDVYEVEYFLAEDEERSRLMRRLWPNPDMETEPGGILTVIAEDIDLFGIRYFDGEEWQMEWPEEMQSLPDLVEVTIAAKRPEGRDSAFETFMVNFARFEGGSGGGRGQDEGESDRGSDRGNNESSNQSSDRGSR